VLFFSLSFSVGPPSHGNFSADAFDYSAFFPTEKQGCYARPHSVGALCLKLEAVL